MIDGFSLFLRSEKKNLKIPFDIEDAKQLGRVLDRYKDLYYFEVMTGICLLYLLWVLSEVYFSDDDAEKFRLITWHNSLHWSSYQLLKCAIDAKFSFPFSLQTFAIPGSLFLSILSGFLFRFPVALTIICSCSAIGATLCYLLSMLLGRRLVKYYFPKRAEQWEQQVKKHKDDMLSYMLFLRMTPLLPNWFINLVAPVIGVPLFPFAFGTFLGWVHRLWLNLSDLLTRLDLYFSVAPPSFLAIEAGKTLYKMTSSTIAFSWSSIFMLFAFSTLALAPVIFKKYFKSKID